MVGVGCGFVYARGAGVCPWVLVSAVGAGVVGSIAYTIAYRNSFM